MTFDDINRDKIAGAQPICAHAVALCRRVLFCPKLDRQWQRSVPSCSPPSPSFSFLSSFRPSLHVAFVSRN